MRTIRRILIACSLCLLLPFAATAQSLSDVQELSKEDRRAYMESMSKDERAAMRNKWRAEFKQLPEERKAAIREQRRAKWESMSEEERVAAREKRGKRKGQPRDGHGKGNADAGKAEPGAEPGS